MNVLDLHIVAFDYPFPPSYGGLIDVYYKIIALDRAGLHIHLHAFYEGEPPHVPDELKALLKTLYLYPRSKKKQWYKMFYRLPFGVETRTDSRLLANLIEVDGDDERIDAGHLRAERLSAEDQISAAHG